MNISRRIYDAVVIGGGLGGLSCALTLVRRGKSVRLVEKNHQLGGNQIYFRRKQFLFEPNIHSVAEAGEGGMVAHALGSLGFEDPVSFVKLDPGACFIYPDEKVVLPVAMDEYLAQLKARFPAEAAGIDALFETMGQIYEGLVVHQGNAPIVGRYAGKVFQDVLDEFVSDPLLQSIVAGFWGWGFPPGDTSGLLYSTLTYSLCAKGNYLPAAGIVGLLTQFEQEIRAGGGEISLNSAAKRIRIRNGKACGVELEDGEIIEAAAVVSNADARTTLFNMVGEDRLPQEYTSGIKQLRPSMSAVNVYLGVEGNGELTEGLAVNNMIYPSTDIDAQTAAMKRGDLEDAPFCITIPTLVHPSFSPEGHHVFIIFAATPYHPEGNGHSSWREKKADYTERLIDMAEKVVPGLKERIVVRDSSTPDTLVRYTSGSHGAIGGWSYGPTTDMARPQPKTPIDGLWLAGHWTVPGPGVHSVIPSGCITASQIP